MDLADHALPMLVGEHVVGADGNAERDGGGDGRDPAEDNDAQLLQWLEWSEGLDVDAVNEHDHKDRLDETGRPVTIEVDVVCGDTV